MSAKITSGRREELLVGVMDIVSARGFSDVRITDMATELHCSLSSLYKIAPNKDSLVVVAVSHWGEIKLARAEADSQQGSKASDRARLYVRSAAEAISPLSHAFRRDLERFGSVRHAFSTISDRFVERLADLIEEAAGSGEVRPINARFVAEFIRYSSAGARDESLLEAAGLSAAEGMLAFDTIFWEGLLPCPSRDTGSH